MRIYVTKIGVFLWREITESKEKKKVDMNGKFFFFLKGEKKKKKRKKGAVYGSFGLEKTKDY